MRLTIALLLIACAAQAQGLRHFNATGVFGKSVDDSVVLLLPANTAAIQPLTIMTDVKDGKYHAATVTFSKTVTLAQARASLNALYPGTEKSSFADDPNMGLWRVETYRFAIQVTHDDQGLRVIYISFQPMESIVQTLERLADQMEPDTEQDESTVPSKAAPSASSDVR